MFAVFSYYFGLYLKEIKGFNNKLNIISNITSETNDRYIGNCINRSDIFIYKINKNHILDFNVQTHLKCIKYISKFTIRRSSDIIDIYACPGRYKEPNKILLNEAQFNFNNIFINYNTYDEILNPKYLLIKVKIDNTPMLNSFNFSMMKEKGQEFKYKAADLLKINLNRIDKEKLMEI